MSILFYKHDFRVNPRRSESSEKVVRFWANEKTVYDVESEVKDSDWCRGIVGERILFRKILGLSELEEHHVPLVRDAHPFGDANPTVEELMSPKVTMGVAFVPLSPEGGEARPIFARLYCVKGLSRCHLPGELQDCALPDRADVFSWFWAGLPDRKIGKRIDGRSWFLAANLLMKIVEKHDVRKIQRLATRYVVTGDVHGESILPVDKMEQKLQLSTRPEFQNFVWMMPTENAKMTPNNPKKFKTPKTLEEALNLLNDYADGNTRLLTDILMDLHYGPRETFQRRVYDLLKKGANPSQVVEDFKMTAQSAVMQRFLRRWQETCGQVKAFLGTVADDPKYIQGKTDVDKALDAFDTAIFDARRYNRVLSYYGGMEPQAFFWFAKVGNENVVQQLLAAGFDINATDHTGATAIDFAIDAGETGAEEVLRRNGAKRPARYEPGNGRFDKVLRETLECIIVGNPQADGEQRIGKEHKKFILKALEYGTSPNEVHEFHNPVKLQFLHEDGDWTRDGFAPHLYICLIEIDTANLMLVAELAAEWLKDEDLRKVCLEKNGNLEGQIKLAKDMVEQGEYETLEFCWLALKPKCVSVKEALEYLRSFAALGTESS